MFRTEGSSAVSDVFWIRSLAAKLSDCLDHGKILPFSEAATAEKQDKEGPVMYYIDDKDAGNYMDIALDIIVDETRCKLMTTYSDMLGNVDVRLNIDPDDNGEDFYSLSVYHKGKADQDLAGELFYINLEDPVRGILY